MTNARAIVQALLYADDLTYVASYIACPYTNNPNCKYPLGCDDCKAEWLEKEWED